MTKNLIKSKEINRSLPGYSAVADLTQNQTAISITNEQPRAEIKTSAAALAGNLRNQEGKCCNWEKVFTGLLVFLMGIFVGISIGISYWYFSR